MTLLLQDDIGLMDVAFVSTFMVDDKGVRVTFTDGGDMSFPDAEVIGAET